MVAPIHCRKLHFKKRKKIMKMKFKPSNLKVAVASAIVVGSVGFSTAIFAGTATDNMIVQASVGISCTISVADIDFGNYDPTLDSDNTATGSVTSSCTTGGAVTLTLGEGAGKDTGSSIGTPVRRMIGSTGAATGTYLPYGLFQDSAHNTLFGGTSLTGKAFDFTGSAIVTTIYGKIPKLQSAAIGGYADSVPVTLTY
jgi:spore coat protein U-like protein